MRQRKVAPLLSVLTLFAVANVQTAQAAVSCSVSVSTLDFGVYNILSATPKDSTSVLTATCTLLSPPSQSVPYKLALSPGLSGSFNPRKMFNAANALSYNLFRNNARTEIWGDAIGAGSFTVSNTISTLTPATLTRSQNNTIFGRISIGQDIASGDYSDSIIVTMTF